MLNLNRLEAFMSIGMWLRVFRVCEMMVREEMVSPVPATRTTVLRIAARPEDRDSEREALGCPGFLAP
jgi:hypothetical protein